MNFVMTLGVVLAVFWFDAAVAQEGYFGHDHDKWHHGFYQTLERPDTKSPCCNLTDCRPTSGRQVDGHYEVKVNGAWVSVPVGKILKQSAPRHRTPRVIEYSTWHTANSCRSALPDRDRWY
jgi:hypothetical protein